MKRALALSVSVLAFTAATAAADSPNIKGSYSFTGTAACLVAPGHFETTAPVTQSPTPGVAAPNAGFNNKFQPIDSQPGFTSPTVGQQSFSRSFSVFGIRTFDGNGNGHVSGTGVGIDARPTPGPGPNGWPHFPPSAGGSDFSYDFTYTVDGNGGWSATMVPNSYTETFTSGPRSTPIVQTATVDAIPPVVGSISNDGKTLILAHIAPAVETRSFSNGDVWPEICHRERVFIKLPDSDNGKGK